MNSSVDPSHEFRCRLRHEFDTWQETGIAPSDPVVLVELYRLFSRIADDTEVVADYGVVHRDAVRQKNAVKDVIKSRFDCDIN